ncbi:hypothetical protein K445DRAFT_165590 [Daldinia sp. EC12]|nr:hypothetical protein K445DRAFT_165590 [Daldinia sp. EC12]
MRNLRACTQIPSSVKRLATLHHRQVSLVFSLSFFTICVFLSFRVYLKSLFSLRRRRSPPQSLSASPAAFSILCTRFYIFKNKQLCLLSFREIDFRSLISALLIAYVHSFDSNEVYILCEIR